YGTLDEFFEALTLIQTDSIKRFPIVLIGKEYHLKLYEHIENLAKSGTIATTDLELFLLTDNVDEAMQHLEKHAIQQFDLRTQKNIKAFGWLGERK
ncbi:MAG: LOG family protein, partial [Bacteroidia bacterium]